MDDRMDRDSILVLDDETAVGDTIRFIGESMDFEVSAYTEPDEFFRVLESRNPTHIVLDLLMPRMDGVEVIRRLAEIGCTARIIIMSGVGGRVLDAARRTAREQGLTIVGVLAKPFSPAALKAYLSAEEVVPEVPGRQARADPAAAVKVGESTLLEALDQEQFGVVFQPVLICSTGELAGFETLVRWQHPDGVIMPDRFIPQAESLGLIDQITRQVLARATGWIARSYPDRGWTLSVNISAASLNNDKLADRLETGCHETGLEPERLILEITETAAMTNAITALEQLTRLRMKGFHLSIDDFGTGYSSLSQLARLPFSELKVDKSFVMTAASSAESRTIIHSMIDLGHNLGLRVVAEGVEDAQTLTYLRHIGCDFAQGYHISRPIPADQIEAWVQREYGLEPKV